MSGCSLKKKSLPGPPALLASKNHLSNYCLVETVDATDNNCKLQLISSTGTVYTRDDTSCWNYRTCNGSIGSRSMRSPPNVHRVGPINASHCDNTDQQPLARLALHEQDESLFTPQIAFRREPFDDYAFGSQSEQCIPSLDYQARYQKKTDCYNPDSLMDELTDTSNTVVSATLQNYGCVIDHSVSSNHDGNRFKSCSVCLARLHDINKPKSTLHQTCSDPVCNCQTDSAEIRPSHGAVLKSILTDDADRSRRVSIVSNKQLNFPNQLPLASYSLHSLQLQAADHAHAKKGRGSGMNPSNQSGSTSVNDNSDTSVSFSEETLIDIKTEQYDCSYDISDSVPLSVTNSGRNRGRGKANEPKFECQVCGDIAAGFHCGAYVCEACKKFYLRCLKMGGGPSFLCSKSNNCDVSKDNRSHCQFCRFKKCIDLGMYKPGCEDEKKLKVDFKSIACKVCNAPSSGFHFGAITCEGCKGFFRRMLKEQVHRKFICTNGGGCTIDSANRTNCKTCRFYKCLKVGMTLEGTRLGRQSNSVKLTTLMQYQSTDVPEFSRRWRGSRSRRGNTALNNINDDTCSDDERSENNVIQNSFSNSDVCERQSGEVDQNNVSIRSDDRVQTSASLNNALKSAPDMCGSDVGGRLMPSDQILLRCSAEQQLNDEIQRQIPEPTSEDITLRICGASSSASLESHNLLQSAISPVRSGNVSKVRNQSTTDLPSTFRQTYSRHHPPPSYHCQTDYRGMNTAVDADKCSSNSSHSSGVRCSLQYADYSHAAESDNMMNQVVLSRFDDDSVQEFDDVHDSATGSSHMETVPYVEDVNRTIIDSGIEAYNDPVALFAHMNKAFRELDEILNRPPELESLRKELLTLDVIWRLVEIPFLHQSRIVLKFIKKIPGFRSLDVDDQVRLAQAALYPLLHLYHSKHYDAERNSCSMFINTQEEIDIILCALPAFAALGNHLTTVGYALKQLDMSIDEMSFLAIMIVFTASDGSSLKCAQSVTMLQDALLEAFLIFNENRMSGTRLSSLLARLPELRRANIEHSLVAAQVHHMIPQVDPGMLWRDMFLTL